MMALWRPAMVGVGAVAATRPPARRTAMRPVWAVRGAGRRGARVELVRELPPQRGVGRWPAVLFGGVGPCHGHTAAPVALRWRWAHPRAA
jgi:hypothetical protein